MSKSLPAPLGSRLPELMDSSDGHPGQFIDAVENARRQLEHGESFHVVLGDIAERVERLSAETRAFLEMAAVAGAFEKRLQPSVLRSVRKLGGEEFLHVLDEAERSGLIASTSGNEYVFKRDIERRHLYDSMTDGRRSLYHSKLGEQRGARGEVVASHLAEAARFDPTLKTRALRKLKAAAETAQRNLKFEVAAELYAKARDLMPESTYPLLLAEGEAYRRAGRIEDAKSALKLAGTLAKDSERPADFARAMLGLGSGFFGIVPGELDRDWVFLMRDALRTLGSTRKALRAALEAKLAELLYYSEHPEERDEADRLSEHAVRVAEGLGDQRTLLSVLNCRRFVVWGRKTQQEGFLLAKRITNLAVKLKDIEMQALGRLWLVVGALERYDMRETDRQIHECVRLYNTVRQPALGWQTELIRAMRALLRGEWSEAEEASKSAQQRGESAGIAGADQFGLVQQVMLARERGDPETLIEPVRDFALTFARPVPAWRAALALILIESGNSRASKTVLDELAAEGLASLPNDVNRVLCLSLMAETYARLRRVSGTMPAVVGDLAVLLIAEGEVNVVVSPGVAVLGSAARYAGLAALAAGQLDDAVHQLKRALDLDRQLASRPVIAHVHADLADALLLHGDRAAAHKERALAESIARDCGMSRLLARLTTGPNFPRRTPETRGSRMLGVGKAKPRSARSR